MPADRSEPEEDLVGRRQPDDGLAELDPDDPDVQALAAHLERMRATSPAFTIEGTVERVGDYAMAARRTRGTVKVLAVVLMVLVLGWLLFVGFRTLLF